MVFNPAQLHAAFSLIVSTHCLRDYSHKSFAGYQADFIVRVHDLILCRKYSAVWILCIVFLKTNNRSLAIILATHLSLFLFVFFVGFEVLFPSVASSCFCQSDIDIYFTHAVTFLIAYLLVDTFMFNILSLPTVACD
jgi:hypothetical protein